MPATQVHTVPPLKVTGFMFAVWSYQVLNSAMELDMFAALKGGKSSAAEVAGKLKLDERATRLMLDALTSMELVKKSGDRYELTDVAEAYLIKGSNLYVGNFLNMRSVHKDSWEKLSETVRTGKPQSKVNQQAEGEKFFKELTAAIFPMNFSTAQTLAEELKVGSMSGEVRVLDLAAGSGVWSLPMTQANKNVKVDALDFPPVLEVTKEFATKYGVADRYHYLAGGWREVKLQPEHYDIIILGHILHSEGKQASEELLKYCAAALKKGGTLVVAEFMENEERSGPIFPALFAINMLLATETGCVFTAEELKGMIQTAGMKDARRLKLPVYGDESPIVVAKK